MRWRLTYGMGALVLAILLSSCQTIQFNRAHVLSESDWPTDGRNPQRSRYSTTPLTLPLEMAWEYSANAGFGPGSPLLLQDRVLVGTRKGEVHSIDLETGRGRGFKRLADVIEGSALISGGKLFVPSAWGNNVVTAFDLNRGTTRWRAEGIPIETPLMAWNDHIIGVDIEGNVIAFDAGSGDRSWSVSLGDRAGVRAAPIMVGEGRLFVATIEGEAFLIDLASQQIVWQKNVGAPVYESPLWSQGILVMSTTRGTLVALDDETGGTIWQFDSGNMDVRIGAPASDGEAVYVGATNRHVYRLNQRSGVIEWTVQLDDVATAAPQVIGRHVFVGTLGRELFAFDNETGTVQWQTALRGRMKSAMAVTDAGILVLSEPKWVTYFVQEGANQ